MKRRIFAHFNPVDFVVNRRTMIEKIYAVLIVACIICIPFVGVNYDLTEYLPESATSKQGLMLMEQEFGYPGTARVMVGPVTIYEAKLIKDKIAAVPGVDMVTWADTATDIYQSQLFLNYDKLEDYYKDEYAVMDVVFEGGDSDPATHAAISEIQALTGEKGAFSGTAVQDKNLNETMIREIAMAMVMGVIMIAVVLCVTTTSWFEPILFLLVMGIAIVINLGTNIFLGRVSFLTFSVAAILQLAIAMDYSVFLLHTYTHERQKGLEPTQAIASALRHAFTSIMSSGATTIVGFIVLCFMSFTIGRDLGIVLAKGIVISLFTVLTLMPALLLRWGDKIEKTAHKPFMPPFRKLGEAAYKARYAVLILIAVLIVPAYFAQSMNHFRYGSDALGSSPGTKIYEDDQAIANRFGRSNMMVAIYPNTSMVTEKEMTDQISALAYVKSATSLAGTMPDGIPVTILPGSITGQLHTENYCRMLIYIRTAAESALSYQCSDELQAILKSYYPDNSYIIGATPSTQDIQEIITRDYNFVNLLSLLGVALVIMFTFRSPIIPIVVMIPIVVATYFNMAVPYLFGDRMIYMGYIIVSCLQLGATVDYSILMTNNYLDRRTQYDKKEAAVRAIADSTLSIITSGSILTIVGYGLYFTSSVAAIGDLGRLVGRGAALSMAMVIFLLPVLLMIFDKRIFNQKRRMEYLARIQKAALRKVQLDQRYRRQQRKRLMRVRRKLRRRKAKLLLKALQQKRNVSEKEESDDETKHS